LPPRWNRNHEGDGGGAGEKWFDILCKAQLVEGYAGEVVLDDMKFRALLPELPAKVGNLLHRESAIFGEDIILGFADLCL
jgi:hypothetical protein